MRDKKVCVITSVHGPFDDRIFHKECQSLVEDGYEVMLIAPHDKTEVVQGVTIIPLPKAGGRFSRMFGVTLRALILALRAKSGVYHLHDPELLVVGMLLKILTMKKVIFDVHEDYEKKILSKRWIRKEVRILLSKIIGHAEKLSMNVFDYALAADSNIKKKFNSSRTEVIANYPQLNLMTKTVTKKYNNKVLRVIYIGGISLDRGSNVMMEAMKYLKDEDIELHLLGKIVTGTDSEGIMSSGKIVYHGCVSCHEVNDHLIDADVGLLLLQPTPSYINCTGEGSVKLFEYMAMKLPVVASDFPFLRKLIADIGSGICVDPTDPVKIADAIKYLHRNPELRKEMGEKGRRAVIDKYNWENESRKLIDVYQKIRVGRRPSC